MAFLSILENILKLWLEFDILRKSSADSWLWAGIHGVRAITGFLSPSFEESLLGTEGNLKVAYFSREFLYVFYP